MKEQEPRQNGKKRKPIPIISYLCGLLAVAVLFTGTTFSRYSTQISGDVQTNLSPFVASYTIQDISSTTFPNMDYWLQVNQSGDETDYRPGSVARTVRFTISNQNENDRVSGVDLQSSIRLHVPAELGDNLVLQVEEVQSGNSVERIIHTPQYIIGNLVYQTTTNAATNEYEYALTDGEKTYRPTGTNVQLNTEQFADYSAFAADDERLNLTGGFDANGEGTIMAEAVDEAGEETGNRISVTSVLRETEYSIGYQRGTSDTDYQSQLFLDLRGLHRYYTIEITLPEMYFTAGDAEEKTFVLYVTLSDQVEFTELMGGSTGGTGGTGGTEDEDREWTSEQYNYLTASNGTPVYRFLIGEIDNTPIYDTIIGYHFETSKVPIYDYTEGNAPASTPRTGETTTVRVTKRYGISDSGTTMTYTGNHTITFQHIAPLTTEQSAQAAIYAHDIRIGTFANGMLTFRDSISSISDIKENQNNYGQCSNYENMPDKERYLIGLDGLTDNPLAVPKGGTYKLFGELSRKYNAQLTVLFVQASEAPTENGVDGEETA